MLFNRLIMFSLVFSGITLSAQAQYTSNSTTTDTARKSQKSVATASTTSTKSSNSIQKQQPTTAKTNPYTGSGSSFTTTTTQAAKKQESARPMFRPRPQQPAVVPPTSGEDDLPSFEALENPTGASKTATAQDPNAPPPPPPPPPKGEIWFYTADFAYRDLTGKTMNCTWKVVLQNKTDTNINQLKIVYTVLGENNPMTFSNVAPNASVVKKHGLYSEKCPAISQSKPKIKIVSCKMGTATGQDCLKYIVVK